MSVRENRILLAILVLSIAGIGLATYLTANHYRFVNAAWCEIGPWSSCEEVNNGPYSEIIPGIPWAVVGLAGFVLIFILAYLRLYFPGLDKREMFIPLMLLSSVIGVVFVVYLNYLEFFVIHKVCILCALSHVLMIIILGLSAWLEYIRRQENNKESAESSGYDAMTRIREGHVLAAVLGLSVVGMGIALFLVYDHFFGADICDPGGWIGCGEINRGPYSTVFGIPWSVIGLVGFTVMFALAYARRFHPEKDKKERLTPALVGLSLAGVASVVYLNYLELAVIHKICPYCAASHLIMLVIAFLLLWWYFFGRLRGDAVGQGDADTDSEDE